MEDKVFLDFDTTGVSSGKITFKVIEEEKPVKGRERAGGYNDEEKPVIQSSFSKNIPYTQGGSETKAVFIVRLINRTELKGKASVFSTRGGVLKEKEFLIK
jgi:hypothetical protein